MNDDIKVGLEHIQKHVTPGLQIRLAIYFIIAIVMIGIAAYTIAKDEIRVFFPIIGMFVGIAIGAAVTRINKISWDHGAKRVITELDAFGVCILIVYIIFEIYRQTIVAYFVHGPSVISTSFALLAGVMAGRILGIQRKISQHLNEHL